MQKSDEMGSIGARGDGDRAGGETAGGVDSATDGVAGLGSGVGAAAGASEAASIFGTRCKVTPVVATDVTEAGAVPTVGGTAVICGELDDASGCCPVAGLSPCNSNFFSSRDAMKPRMRARVCFFSAAEETDSLRW